MRTDRQRLEERRDLAVRDLVELDDQIAIGEISQAHAQGMRARFEAEAATALQALAELDEQPAKQPASPSVRRRWPVRLAGVATAIVVGLSAVVMLPGAVADRPAGGFVTGNEATAGRDLDGVTNAEMEAVVADNPDVVPMRLRLAHRYLDAGDYTRAFEHYSAVLDRQDDPVALSHLGWVVFNQGEAALAEQLVTASLDLRAGEPEALWFLANIRLLGTGDPSGAIEAIDQLAVRGDLDEQDRAMLADARTAATSMLDDAGGDP